MTKKQYKDPSEEKAKTVKEPAIAYSATPHTHLSISDEDDSLKREKSLSERKAAFIHAILNDIDEEVFTILETAYSLLNSKTDTYPCLYSVEELREKYDLAVKQAEAGEILSHEEVRNRYKNRP